MERSREYSFFYFYMNTQRIFRRAGFGLLMIVVSFSPLSSFISSAAIPIAYAQTPTIIIGEVAWAGSSTSTADEWLEIWNLGDAAQPLAGWSLRGAGGITIPFSATSTIPANGLVLISNYSLLEKTVLQVPPDVVTTTISLSNSALRIDLLDAQSNIVDTAGTGGAPPAGSSTPTHASMIRSRGSDGNFSWITASISENLRDPTLNLGTPGICDGCAIAAMDPPPPSEIMIDTSTTEAVLETVEPTSTLADIPSDVATSSVSEPPIDVTSDATSSTTSSAAFIATESASETVMATSTTFDPPTILTTYATQTNSSSTTQTVESAPTQPSNITTPPYRMIRLNEIFPIPSTGKEWIELTTLDASAEIPLDGCELFDASGRIMTLTHVQVSAVSPYVVIPLASSHLNNAGDSVSVRCPMVGLIDAMTYGKTAKDVAWVRSPDRTGAWTMTTNRTPGAPNILRTPLMTTQASTTSTTQKITSSKAGKTQAKPTSILPIEPTILDEMDEIPDIDPTLTENADEDSRTLPARTRTSSPPLFHLSIEDLSSMNTGMRVELQGIVGTPPGLLPNHRFILLSSDGRGVVVALPKNQKLPTQGHAITVTGALQFSDRNIPELRVNMKDFLHEKAIPSSQEDDPQPRIVDLLAPSAEDAWSLVAVSGTIQEIKGQTIELDANGVALSVRVRPGVSYRVNRLHKGDSVLIRGVIDTSMSDPTLYPRSGEDIQFLKPASPHIATDTSIPHLPPWLPLSSAIGAVGATEGVKRFRERLKRKKLEQTLLETTSEKF